jgi:hypothetical protein
MELHVRADEVGGDVRQRRALARGILPIRRVLTVSGHFPIDSPAAQPGGGVGEALLWVTIAAAVAAGAVNGAVGQGWRATSVGPHKNPAS